MAKTLKPQTIFGKDLEALAEKFGKIPTDLTKSGDIIAQGFLTQEEFDNLPYCPRSSEMTSATAWPKIGGRKTYPLSGALTLEETEMYYEYKKNHKPGTASVSSPKAEENNKALDELKEELIKLKVSADIIAKLEKFRIAKKVGLISEMFGVDTIQQLTGKVNLAYVMFRGPNGEFSEELQPNMVDLVQKGFMPKFTLQQVKDNIEKLAGKGIILDKVIVDLK